MQTPVKIVREHRYVVWCLTCYHLADTETARLRRLILR